MYTFRLRRIGLFLMKWRPEVRPCDLIMLSSIEISDRLISVAKFRDDNVKEVSHLVVDVIISRAFRCIALVKEMQIPHAHYLQESVAWEYFTNPGNGCETVLVGCSRLV